MGLLAIARGKLIEHLRESPEYPLALKPDLADDLGMKGVEILSAERASSQALNLLESRMVGHQIADIRSTHDFTPGMYIRGCDIPPFTLLVTETHKTEHPFCITRGEVYAWTAKAGWIKYLAPYRGITKPGTKRVLYTETGCFWTTYHPNPENITDVEAFSERILEPHENDLLPEGFESGWKSQALKIA